jgi:hypothetical protein
MDLDLDEIVLELEGHPFLGSANSDEGDMDDQEQQERTDEQHIGIVVNESGQGNPGRLPRFHQGSL